MTRENRMFFPRKSSETRWLLALGLALVPVFTIAPGWADNYTLDSVDFATTGGRTNIILHTGSIVPVQKVLISENKLVLDIDQINAEETVHTNFSGAGNISHVILQPVNEHKIRMIVRGENLGEPSVAFYDSHNGAYSAANPDYGRNAEPATLISSAAAVLQPTENAQTTGLPEENSVQPAATSKTPMKTAVINDETLPFGGHGQPAAGDAKPADVNAPLSLQPNDAPAAAGNGWLDKLNGNPLGASVPAALLGLLMLGVGGFVIHKINRLKQGPPDLEDLLEEQAHGKRVSFREMADAYRGKTEVSGKKPHAEDVIGLRSLAYEAADERAVETSAAKAAPASRASQPAVSLEQMIAAIQAANHLPKAPVKAPAPKKQAVNQYLQQQSPQAQAKPKARSVADELTIKETRRAQTVQQELLKQTQAAQPVNRAAAAQKAVKPPTFQSVPTGSALTGNPAARPATQAKAPAAPRAAASGQGPLPGNPEVLNFLRNVAELMEKDGKTEIAKNIHKNLNPKNAGLKA